MSDAPPVPLHCFAHAGAGVSVFHGWSAGLGDGALPVPHLLPGRDRRRREPRATGRDALLADLLDGFRSPAGPYVLYGHSLGALVAYTLARALHEAGLPTPALLAVGACPPPDAASVLSDACRESPQRLRDLLDTVGAGPRDAVPGGLWQRKVLPVLRDDLVLADALRGAARQPVAGHPFRVPLLVVAGADDPLAPPSAMAGWHRWTAGRVVTRTLPGDHFFVRGHPLPRLLGRTCRVVRRLAAGPAPSTTQGRA
ncbi:MULTISPECIES: thioesterase II family protein [unclassified Streptomyces]|uniref:thioesterase II family protein n=1 Tax=unclassified Streptomyces TaxID=2593676 RepID=UPI0024429EBA|nr:thioesterase domain-containing protein [Streptomyces sp. DH41]MDG9723651.1 thioesterase domain-containing protein [Streptomyces sp. DH41]